MTRYFAGFADALDPDDVTRTLPLKVPDTGGDRLPFGHLDDRRFEILAYRLKTVEFKASRNPIALMQGVGERGRDVIVYSPAGRVAQIVQCKNLSDRMTAPALRRELVKLALHSYLDPEVLDAEGVQYELWCPADFTEPAARLADTWPRAWTLEALSEDAAEVIAAYAAFKGLRWDAIGPKVTQEFAARVRVTYQGGIDISVRARSCLPIYESFFQGKIVMTREDVIAAIRDTMAETTGFTQLKDEDAKHMITRVTSFPADQRVIHAAGYVMGIPLPLMSRLNRNEFESFTRHAMNATAGVVQVVLQAGARLSSDTARVFRETVQPTNKSITHVFAKTLTGSMIDRIQGIVMLVNKFPIMGSEYRALSLRERHLRHASETWGEYQRCLAGYDPSKHPPASDEEFRHRIALHGIDGAPDRQTFETELAKSFDAHRPELEKRFAEFMALFPEQLLVITDTMTIFDNQQLMDRMAETVQLIERLRGTSILPE